MKYIREGRMGPPKSGKSWAIYSSYPRPLLALVGGRREVDSVKDAVEWCDFDSIGKWIETPRDKQPPLLALDFWGSGVTELNQTMTVSGDLTAFPRFNTLGNRLAKAKQIPWKTVVLDPITRLQDIVVAYLAGTNEKIMSDARFWVPQIGTKMFQIISVISSLPCHTVITMHVTTDKNEVTSDVRTEPAFLSRRRYDFPSILSQVFYHDYINGEPKVYTKPVAFAPGLGTIKGIGCSWPSGLTSPCGPLFNDIYGAAVKSGETTA